MRRLVAMVGLVTIVALLALPTATGAAGEQAGGTLVDATGKPIGTVQLVQTQTGVAVTVKITAAGALSQGPHGIHFHAVGKCDGPDFTTAGGHFNPLNKQHGLDNPNGPHAGDLPNFDVGAATASQSGFTFMATTSMISLTPGPTSIFDTDGTALVIHAGPDDEKTDPAGNSGARVACAVLTQGAPSATTGTTAPAPVTSQPAPSVTVPVAAPAPVTQAPAPPRTGGGGTVQDFIRRLGDG